MDRTKKPIRRFLHSLLNKLNLDGWMLLFVESGLKQDGWFGAFRTKTAIDNNGNPIPWVTYPFIDFISERLNSDMNIFEFGSGNSTLYYAQKVNSITSVEHNQTWYKKMSEIIPSNVNLIFKELIANGEYSRHSKIQNTKYDIIIIDGEDRNNCIYNSINSLNNNGVFVLDDSEREEYNEAVSFLNNKNFKRLDFWGMAPGILYKKCTTIFYKSDNCLNI